MAVFGGLGAVLSASAGPAPAHDIRALAERLGAAVDGSVAPSDVRWEPSAGLLADLVVGRRVLFLASAKPGQARDLYRARVRLTPDGRPLGIADARDLTATPLGDEHGLVVRGGLAAYATFAYGQEQSVSVLDLKGAPFESRGGGLGERVMARLTALQETGSLDGLGRTEITLDEAAPRVGLALGDDGALAIDMFFPTGTRRAMVDVARGEVLPGAPGIRVETARPTAKRLVHWGVDTVRAVVGPAPIAWLEDKVFAARDALRRATYHPKVEGALAELVKDDGAPPAPALDGARASEDDGGWPPAPLRSPWRQPEPGEGVWHAPRLPWLRKLPTVGASAPPPFVRTFVRPDSTRPYVQVTLVAMDTRQLDLEMEAGLEDPKPLIGAHGSGRIPRDPNVYNRVVGMFNGAFKTEHGQYGMMVKRRVLLPPQPNAATIATLKDGRIAFGSWPAAASGASALGAFGGNGTASAQDLAAIGLQEASFVSFRQNLEPLLDLDKVNPAGRGLWGFTLPGTGAQTERSGLCVTELGHLVYAWGEDLNASALGKAMKMAGCTYGVHLDMNPHHAAFVFATIDDIKARKWKTELASSEMDLWADKYIEGAQKDFFYVLLHDPKPPTVPGITWDVSAGVQPAPTFLPALWAARTSNGGSPGDVEVELFDIEPHRLEYRIRGGTKEPDFSGLEAAHELAAEEASRVVFSVGMGVAWEKRMRGLATDGRQILPTHGGSTESPTALLVAQPGRGLGLHRIEEVGNLVPHMDIVELPLLFDGEDVFPAANVHGSATQRLALGVTPEGRIVIARALAGSNSVLRETLRRVGCHRAVLLDRGVHGLGFLDRAGTPSPPRAHYDETVLYGIATPMKPRGFRFDVSALGQRAVSAR